ncbi:MAG: FAD-dependent oxidoreductase [Bifidobacteriaceae bacterium]|nr:FAD-dependent oxidoreductase [Bifidobacteriaceae bacterium]
MTAGGLTADAAVVGGGPAGLVAATTLARAGLRTILIDEQPAMGGQYFRQRSAALRTRLGDHRPQGRRLIEEAGQAGVQCMSATSVWGAESNRLWTWTEGAGVRAVEAASIVVATGSFERQFPFAGWQHSGVVSIGLAAHLAGVEATAVGRRVVVAGSGPLLLPAAAAIVRAGGQVVAVVEAGHPYSPRLGSLRAARYPGRLIQLGGALATLARQRVRLIQGHVVIAAQGNPDGQLERISLAACRRPDGESLALETDTLCVGYGFRPQTELFRLLGADMATDSASGDLFPVIDSDGRTSVPGLYAAGEVTGIGGVQAALVEGRLVAGAVLADQLGAVVPGTAALRRAKRRAERFGELAARLYPQPSHLARRLAAALPDSAQLCRCEGVSAGAVRAAIAQTGQDAAAVKQTTRAGMGLCQGRACGVALAALAGEPASSLTARMPLRPVPVDALAKVEA